MAHPYCLEISHITKIFPGVKALDDVAFTLRPGEIHALVGENGAGKSTFIKVLTGVYQPDGGEILLDGKPVVMANPVVAQSLGIAAIYQHVTAYPDLTVAENIFMGHEITRGPLRRIDWKATNRRAEEVLRSLGSDISPRETMGALPLAQQQLVEIAKALSQNARVLIMDEPTAALSGRESEELYRISLRLREQGTAIILISHRFEDVFRLADRVTVFRDARYIGTWDVRDMTSETLVHHMVGRDIEQLFPKKQVAPGEALLRVENLARTGFFQDISFTLHAGEILGLTGLVGAGRTEIVESIFGITQPTAGQVYIKGKAVSVSGPHAAMALGLGLLPEDRQKQGLLLPWSIERNITLPTLPSYAKGRFLSTKGEYAAADRFRTLLAIKAQTVRDTAASLSGGNQQKVIVGKLLGASPQILILDEPTKGVDVGSKAAMYEIMCDLAARGMGIVLISSEMPEVMSMSDRILILREGRISAEVIPSETTQEKILMAAMPVGKAN
ncbi:ribose import ATP-binding protein RbsA [Clostridia bacterium]|nr:ribose import ATP-binding protein RbsA [Clostridia bacterium]